MWDGPRARLLWVDIAAGLVYEGGLADGRITPRGRTALGEMTGAVVPSAGGAMLVAGQERLWLLPGEGRPAVPGPRIIPYGAHRRCNDGATDPAGRFLVGTMSLDGASTTETLVRLETDGRLSTLDDDLGLSNGLAWSADGTRMFSADTPNHVVWVRSYDAATGAAGPREPFLTLGEALPDGILTDAADHLWVALWGSGELRRYAPDGTPAGRLELPAPCVTSVALAGPDLGTLVITTARDELTDAQQRTWPDSGRIFTARAPAPGLPVVPWSGAAGFGTG